MASTATLAPFSKLFAFFASPAVTEGPKPTLLDYIDLGYWFSKIGKNFDTPDTKVIDTEYIS